MSRDYKMWRLLSMVFFLVLLLLGVELLRRNKLMELMTLKMQRSTRHRCPVKEPHISEPCNCNIKEAPAQKEFNASSLASMQMQTRTEVLEELRTNWLKPPALEHYSVNSTENREDMYSVRKLHRTVLRILKEKRNGFFIECGAYDGVMLSNTLHLEQSYNWTGLLVEADPLNYQHLLKAHRKAWTINACLGIQSEPQKVLMTRVKRDRLLSVISKLHPANRRKNSETEEFEAQCFPLGSFLAALGQSLNVDYLSLDIEGAELGVLSTVPWDFVYIKVISVESTPERIPLLRAYLEDQNYLFGGFVEGPWIHDYIFIHGFYEPEMAFGVEDVQEIITYS